MLSSVKGKPAPGLGARNLSMLSFIRVQGSVFIYLLSFLRQCYQLEKGKHLFCSDVTEGKCGSESTFPSEAGVFLCSNDGSTEVTSLQDGGSRQKLIQLALGISFDSIQSICICNRIQKTIQRMEAPSYSSHSEIKSFKNVSFSSFSRCIYNIFF